MKKNTILIQAILMIALCSTGAKAETPKGENAQTAPTTAAKSESTRMEKKMGGYFGLLGDPHPTLVGMNLAYNLTDYLRTSIGYGKVSVSASLGGEEVSLTTFGFAGKFLVPGWSVSPSGTLGYSHISWSDTFSNSEYKGSNIYAGFGGDWQAESGLNLGVGMNVSLNGGAPSAPYLNVGMFF